MIAFWTVFILLTSVALSAPAGENKWGSGCKNPRIRREWDTLSIEKKAAFHKAVKCLRSKPSMVQSHGESKTRYDDFPYVHYTIRLTIHHVSTFFPWHRYFITIRERELSKCGYHDPMPYWDWTKDATAGKFNHSRIWDPSAGFGGIGQPAEGNQTCVQDGPYAGMMVNIPQRHCLNRDFNVTDTIATNWTIERVKQINDLPDYFLWWNNTERMPHDNVHRSVGGDMGVQYSPNDPVFFLHHTQLDRIWTLWQGRNKARIYDYSGNTVQNVTTNTARLSDTLHLLGLAEDRPVWSVMDTMDNGFCYTYDKDLDGNPLWEPEQN